MYKHTAIRVTRYCDGMAVMGRTVHDLRGIRYNNGEGGAAAAGEPAAPGAPAAPTAAPAARAAPTPAAPAAPAFPVNYRVDPDGYARELREEVKQHRLPAEAATAKAAGHAAVNKAITDALETNSAFKTGPVLGSTSGGGHQGGCILGIVDGAFQLNRSVA